MPTFISSGSSSCQWKSSSVSSSAASCLSQSNMDLRRSLATYRARSRVIRTTWLGNARYAQNCCSRPAPSGRIVDNAEVGIFTLCCDTPRYKLIADQRSWSSSPHAQEKRDESRLRDDRQWEKFEIATEPFLVSVVYIHRKLTGGPVSSHSI